MGCFGFEEGDVVDADGEEGTQTGGLGGEEVCDGERDVGEDGDVVDWLVSGWVCRRGKGRYRSCRLARLGPRL